MRIVNLGYSIKIEPPVIYQSFRSSSLDHTTTMSSKKVLIYGGRGALGSTMASHFKSCGWWVCSVDLVASDAADASVIVDPKADWLAQGSERLYRDRLKNGL